MIKNLVCHNLVSLYLNFAHENDYTCCLSRKYVSHNSLNITVAMHGEGGVLYIACVCPILVCFKR